MRILAIAQLVGELRGQRQRVGEHLALIGEGEPLRDHAVVGRGVREGGRGEALAEGEGGRAAVGVHLGDHRSEEHTSELQSLMRISYAVFCLKKKKKKII